MLCVDELYELLEQCTGDTWGRCSSKPALHNNERVQVFRWVHMASSLGFVMVLCDRSKPVEAEELRSLINYFRQWGGRNLGLLTLLPAGMKKGAEHALPYYGYLRTAILDYPNERLHFGTDSSRFQVLVAALVDTLGIPAGGEAKGEVFVRQCNSYGPKTWTRNQLQRYAQDGLLEWHPLYLSALFPDLLLTLDGHLHHDDTVILLFPQATPVCSYSLCDARLRYPNTKIFVIYAHSCTRKTVLLAEEEDVELIYAPKNILETLMKLGFTYVPINNDVLFWHPHIWFAYLRVIAPVSQYKIIGNAILVDEKILYLSALSMAELLDISDSIHPDCTLVLHTQFAVEKSFFRKFPQYVWLYRDEIFQTTTIPIAAQRAFIHFQSYSVQRRKQPRWQDRFFEKDGCFFDRYFGHEVELFDNISPEHPWLLLGFMLSMHTHTIPFLLYDKEQEVLVVANPPKKETAKIDKGILHLESIMRKMGIQEKDFGRTYDMQGSIVMSLVED